MARKEDREQSIWEHLTELRRRLMISAIALAATTGIAFAFNRPLMHFLLAPTRGVQGVKFVFTEMTEMVGITMRVSLLGGFVLALPVITYEVMMFVAPALTPRERKYLYAFLAGTVVSFLAGAAFGYYVLFPPAMRFLLTFGGDIAEPFIRIENYLSLVTRLLFWMGVVFELPMAMFFLSRLGVVTPERLVRFRRLAFIGAFLLGAMITPTIDPVNQMLVSVPIILLYEAGILLAKLARRGKKQAA